MLRAALIVAAVELVATGAGAATLTITPDKAVYSVGENIVLSVVGDSEGGTESFVYGRLVFNDERASCVSASQTPLTSFNGTVQWVPLPLVGGPGFGEAFFQIGSVNDFPVDNLLEATAVLLATTPGTLDLAWGSAGDELRFFGLTTAPGVSVDRLHPAIGLEAVFVRSILDQAAADFASPVV